MNKHIPVEVDGGKFVLWIGQQDGLHHRVTIWQLLEESLDRNDKSTFGTVNFFGGSVETVYGLVGSDYERGLLKGEHSFDALEHNAKIRGPARQRAYNLIYRVLPWLKYVNHAESGEGVWVQLAETSKEEV